MNSDRSVQYGAHNLRGLELTWDWTSLRPPLIHSAVCYLFVVYGSVIQLRRFRFLTLRSRVARKRDTDAARLFARSLSSNYNANEMLFMWPPRGPSNSPPTPTILISSGNYPYHPARRYCRPPHSPPRSPIPAISKMAVEYTRGIYQIRNTKYS